MIWWLTIFAISCAYCILQLVYSYQRWESSPTIVTFATTEKPIWEIPFPAITVCPQVKSDPSIFNYTDVFHKKEDNVTLSEEKETQFDYMSLICGFRENLNYTVDFVRDEDIYDFYDNVTSHLGTRAYYVTFMNQQFQFNETFTPILTDDGVCYTFNMLDRNELFANTVKHYKNYHKSRFERTGWTLDGGYETKSAKNVYPKRTAHAGALSSLYLELYIESTEVDYACAGGWQGFKVQVHHPADMPHVHEQYFHISLDQSLMATVEPKMMVTSEEVKLHNWKKRGCYLPSERKLKFFKFYTQNNCELECKTNITLEKCKCVNYYMPHDNSTFICGAANLDCMTHAKDFYFTHFDDLSKIDCNCLPDCTSLTYSVEISQTDYDWENEFKAERYIDEFNKKFTKEYYRASSLTVFYRTKHFIPLERRELMSFTDLLANFGGLLSLFIGFSVLSLVEVIYFLTVRIWCNAQLYGRKLWFGLNHRNKNEL